MEYLDPSPENSKGMVWSCGNVLHTPTTMLRGDKASIKENCKGSKLCSQTSWHKEAIWNICLVYLTVQVATYALGSCRRNQLADQGPAGLEVFFFVFQQLGSVPSIGSALLHPSASVFLRSESCSSSENPQSYFQLWQKLPGKNSDLKESRFNLNSNKLLPPNQSSN